MESEILQGLLQRGYPMHIAQGIVANLIAESGLNAGINEAAPLVPGSRGGYGLAQWTGPRRRQYEAFAAERGVSPDDVNAQLDFLDWELRNTERGAMDKLQGATDPIEAARVFSDSFLRPGIPHMDRRLSEAARIAGMEYGPQPASVMAGMPQQFPMVQADPFDGMGLGSRIAAMNGIAQDGDASPLVNLWNIISGKKADPAMMAAIQNRPNKGLLGFFG